MHHRPMSATILTAAQRAFLASARTATLATIAPDGAPRLVPVCFVLAGEIVYSPLDEKPKAVDDVRDLARVRDLIARPDVGLLVHRWSEDWDELGWLRLRGKASLLEAAEAPERHATAVRALRAKYPQYAGHDLESRPLVVIEIVAVRAWGRLA
jgi:PPOX class probable F420-dependent enzyme